MARVLKCADQVGRDVGHQEYNLLNRNANQQPLVTYKRGMLRFEFLAPVVPPQLLPLLQGVLRSLEEEALTHLDLHQEHPMTLLPHPVGSWRNPASQVDHNRRPYSAAHSLAAGSAALSVAAELSSAAAESAAAAC